MNDLFKKSVEQIKSEIDNIVSEEYKLTINYQKAIEKISTDFFIFNYNLSQFISGVFSFGENLERCFKVNDFIYIPNIPWDDPIIRFNNRILLEKESPLGLSVSSGNPYSNFYLHDNYRDARDFNVYTQIPDLDNTIGTYLFEKSKSLYLENESIIRNNIEMLKSFNDLFFIINTTNTSPELIFNNNSYLTIEEIIVHIKKNKEILLITHDLDISNILLDIEKDFKIKHNEKIKMI